MLVHSFYVTFNLHFLKNLPSANLFTANTTYIHYLGLNPCLCGEKLELTASNVAQSSLCVINCYGYKGRETITCQHFTHSVQTNTDYFEYDAHASNF
jgi:hypothetical protein